MAITLNRWNFEDGSAKYEDFNEADATAVVDGIKDYAQAGIVGDKDWEESVRAVVGFQLEDGSFPIVIDRSMPSDIRVQYLYCPSYACCQVLIHALVLGREVAGMKDALAKGLRFACGQKLSGHGYDAAASQAEELRAFGLCGTVQFLEMHPDVCPEFTRLVEQLLNSYEQDLKDGRALGMWGEDLSEAYRAALEAFGRVAH